MSRQRSSSARPDAVPPGGGEAPDGRALGEVHEPAPSTTRRVLLQGAGLTLFGIGTGAGFLGRMAGASTARNATDRALVVVFLRGAMDGLMAVQPLGDSFLRAARPSLLLTPGRGELPPLDLGNGFALHPALAPLLPIWQRGEMAVVHGCGSPHPTRSHFDAQDFMETATPGRKGVEDGWLNRLARSNGADRALFGAVSLTGMAPRSLQGPAPALAIPDLQRFQLARPAAGGAALEALYRDSPDGLLRSRGAELFDSLRLLGSEEVAAYRSARAARYPKSPLAQSLMQIAFLLRQGVGLRIGFAESGGWDTHIRQGREQGSFAVRAGDLAASLAAFWEDLGDLADRVTVLTMTEFGRTVAENGTGGTDHGHGSCLFLLGRNVHGARVHGSLPELRPEELFAGRDLPVTTDFRAVLCDVADKVFGVRDDEFLFPGWYGAPADVLWG